MNRTCKWLYKYTLYSPEYDEREGGGKQNTKKVLSKRILFFSYFFFLLPHFISSFLCVCVNKIGQTNKNLTIMMMMMPVTMTMKKQQQKRQTKELHKY